MRKLETGTSRYTEIHTMDELGPGGAYHKYHIGRADVESPTGEFAEIKFQYGPVLETGVNGCSIEDLIVICIDQLKAFQEGEFDCVENAMALDSLKSALYSLNQRTQDRQSRGAEGKTVK